MRVRGIRGAFALLLVSALVACGGGGAGFGDSGDGGDDGDDTGDGGTTISVTTLSLLASSSELPADADTAAEGVTLTAVARNASNNVVSGVNVSFAATSGELQVTTPTTGSDGRATAILTTAGNANLRTITVVANGGGQTASFDIPVVSPSSSNTPAYRMGIVDGSSFTSGQIAIGQSPLAAGGSSGLSLSIVDSANDNTLYTGDASVTFSSTCIANGLASVSPNPVVVANGNVNVTYSALGCSGGDVVRANTVVDGQALSATGSIEVEMAELGSVEFLSAEPTTIGLQGSGLTETSTVVFRVVNSSGGPVPNQFVEFTLNTNAGGIKVNPESGMTATDGTIQTVVRSGTVHTSVRVTATITVKPGDSQDDSCNVEDDDACRISSQSELLIVTTGLPDQDSFSVSVSTKNVEGLSIDGVTSEVTVRAADRFNNPVPDGTAIAFTTEGGAIVGGCTTSAGACSATWTSQDPRPVAYNDCDGKSGDRGSDDQCSNGPQNTNGASRAGRSSVLVTAIGEESFVDTDGDGRYDDAETFGDLGEAYRDADEDGRYDLSSDEFADFNSNGMRDDGDERFNGTLCDDASVKCAPSGMRTLNVRRNVTIVMSGSSPVIDESDDADIEGSYEVSYKDCREADKECDNFEVDANQSFIVSFVVRDTNDQPMPAGTTIALTAEGDGSLLGTSSYVVPNTIDDTEDGNTYGFAFKAADIDEEGSASMELKVTAPSGLVTSLRLSVKVKVDDPPEP